MGCAPYGNFPCLTLEFIGNLWRCFPQYGVTFGHIAMEEDTLPFDAP